MKHVYIETYGCSANQNNSEIMAGLLQQLGFDIVINPKLADIIIINSCIVKSPTENKIIRRIQDFSKTRKILIVAGCMPEVPNKIKEIAPNSYQISVHHIKGIGKLIRLIINNKAREKQEEFLSEKPEIKLNCAKIRKNKIISITQISNGCVGNCAFCQTRIAKGKLFSYPETEIIKNIESDLHGGCKEIWLTSQDNAAFGLDNKENNLPNLLRKILNLPHRFMLRNGMLNPNNVLPILDELIEIYKNKKMFKFLHLPLQSGSDKILKLMNRNYLVSDFLKIIEKFKREIPELTISTDIIVAFPSETEEDFEKTLKIIQEVKPDILNISKYWPRKATEAEKMEQINVEIAKKRAVRLMNLHKSIAEKNAEKWQGWQGKILVDRKGFDNTYLARNSSYKLIVVQSDKNIIGKWINVKVNKTAVHYLYAKIV